MLGVSEAGFYEHRRRPPSERAIRHAWLTDLIAQIHAESRGTYGIHRVHAELTLGRDVAVGHNQVALLMRRAGLQGITGRRKWKRIRPDNIAIDLVERDFARQGPNQLRVTDIEPDRVEDTGVPLPFRDIRRVGVARVGDRGGSALQHLPPNCSSTASRTPAAKQSNTS